VQTVTAALLLRDGRILLALRKAGNTWDASGSSRGKVHPGETPEQCLERELAEELDICARIGLQAGRARYTKEDLDLEILLYRAEYLSGTFTLHDHEAIAWVPPAELASYDLADSDRELAEQALASLK